MQSMAGDAVLGALGEGAVPVWTSPSALRVVSLRGLVSIGDRIGVKGSRSIESVRDVFVVLEPLGDRGMAQSHRC